MLWPSLLHLDADGLLPEGLALFGVARLQGTDESFKVGLRADLSGRDGINAAVLDRFLADYASVNSFTQVVIRSDQRGVIKTWAPRTGQGPLL